MSLQPFVQVMKNHRPLVSVLIADDHPLVLRGLVTLVCASPDIKVVAQCQEGRAALKAIEKLAPDVAVLDLAMPYLGGLEILSKLITSAARTKVVLLTATASDPQVSSAIKRGASALLYKDVATDELIQCIRVVARGGKWLSTAGPQHRLAVSDIAQLSIREQDVVRVVATGVSNKEIAHNLGLTEGTVKVHLHNIYQKLGVPNRTALTALLGAERNAAA